MTYVFRDKVEVGGTHNIDLKTVAAVARHGASLALEAGSRAGMEGGNGRPR